MLAETQRLQELLRRIGSVLQDIGVVGLVGEFLSSVVFVMDYIQLDFNGSSITSYSWPVIDRENKKFTLADPGYRDMLCRLIGASVSEVTLATEELIVRFASGISLTISLRPEDVSGPEVASFISETGLLWVW